MANGRYTGGGIIVDPYACMNDGLVDICWIHDENIMSLFGVAVAEASAASASMVVR